MTEPSSANPAQTAKALYIAYVACALSLFMPFVSLLLLGTLVMIVALVIAYQQRAKTAGTIYESHFHWLIRTFWIGGGVYLPVLSVVAAVVTVCMVDFTSLNEALRVAAMENAGTSSNDTAVVIATAQKSIMTESGDKLIAIALIFILPFVGWWFWRCWKGFRLLAAGKPVENTTSWI